MINRESVQSIDVCGRVASQHRILQCEGVGARGLLDWCIISYWLIFESIKPSTKLLKLILFQVFTQNCAFFILSESPSKVCCVK